MVQAFVREPILHLLLKISDNRSSWIITRQQLFPSKINKPSNERKQRHPSLQVPSYWLLEFQQFFLAEIYIHQKNSYQIKFQQGMRGGKYNKILMGLISCSQNNSVLGKFCLHLSFLAACSGKITLNIFLMFCFVRQNLRLTALHFHQGQCCKHRSSFFHSPLHHFRNAFQSNDSNKLLLKKLSFQNMSWENHSKELF